MDPSAILGANSDDEDDLDIRESWMWGGKRAFIFLIDASEKMFEKKVDDTCYFSTCLQACKSIMLQNIYYQQKDLFGIVMYGTKHLGQAAQPNHVTTLQSLALCNADKIREIIDILEDIQGFERKHGHSNGYSLADALWHCHKMVSTCTTKIYQKTLYLMTCNDNPHASDLKLQHAARTRATDLCGVDLHLEIVPLGIRFDPMAFFKELYVISRGDDDVSSTSLKSVETEDQILSLIDRSPNKRSTSRVLWCLGEDVKIGVAAYRFVRSTTPFPKKIKVERSRNAIVASHVQNFNTNTGEEVSRAEISKAMVIGGQTIKFEPEDLKKANELSKPGLILLGFKPSHTLEIWFHKKTPYFLYPEERLVKGSRTLFAALHQRCLERKVVAICYFTARRSGTPSLVALSPLEENLDKKTNSQRIPPGFLLRHLPYADNIRDLKDQQVKCDFPEPELVTVAEKIIDKMKFNFEPSLIDNPKHQTLWNGIEALALGYEEPNVVSDNTCPDYEVIDSRVQDLATQFMSLAFPNGIDEAVQKSAKRPASGQASAPKKIKPDLENMTMDGIAKQGLVEKLTVDKLKQYLTEENVRVTKMKKAELVAAVYDHLGVVQP